MDHYEHDVLDLPLAVLFDDELPRPEGLDEDVAWLKSQIHRFASPPQLSSPPVRPVDIVAFLRFATHQAGAAERVGSSASLLAQQCRDFAEFLGAWLIDIWVADDQVFERVAGWCRDQPIPPREVLAKHSHMLDQHPTGIQRHPEAIMRAFLEGAGMQCPPLFGLEMRSLQLQVAEDSTWVLNVIFPYSFFAAPNAEDVLRALSAIFARGVR